MKKAILLFLFTSAVLAKEIVNVSYTPLKPYSTQSQTEGIVGICPNIAKKVFNPSKTKFKSIYAPWKRTLLNARYGETDVIICISKTEDREEYLNFSEPLGTVGYYLITHKSLPKIDFQREGIFNSLKKYRFVLTTGAKLNGKEMQKLLKLKSTVLVDDIKNFLNMIYFRRADYTIFPKASIDFYMTDKVRENLRIYEVPLVREFVYAGISKKSKLITKEWIDSQLKANGYTSKFDIDKVD